MYVRKQVASSQAHADDFLSKIAAKKKGQLSAIIQGMLQYPGRENVQEQACGALKNLAANADNQVKVAAEGGIRAILGAMQGHKHTHRSGVSIALSFFSFFSLSFFFSEAASR